ncbi:hypothetical protein [uncultured Duncaniella sp.]|uniref:hypothetical protein n=1 Tax=uncultured Duncaniella sp. TaxID=2768039 RepID=UPI0026EFB183|nr:hypothetical protein [uncultured Duncaniella sp.]
MIELKVKDPNEKSEILAYAETMFLPGGKMMSNGISIEMENGKRLVVSFFERKYGTEVEISIGRTVMGVLKTYTSQGYSYVFEQKKRVGMRNGLTMEEQFVEDTCRMCNDKVLLRKAYH